MAGQLKVFATAIVALITTTLVVQANATPVSLTGSYNDGASNSISGNLQGNYSGNVLTLNGSSPANEIVVDLANPPNVSLPSPIFSSTVSWEGFTYTVKGYLNESYSLHLAPWPFQVGGNVEFDSGNPLGGTANLTAFPLSDYIGSFSGSATPTFTVTAAHIDSVVGQLAANAAGAVLRETLNAANWHVLVDGAGYWDYVDLGPITLSSTQNAGSTDLGLSFSDITLGGSIGFNAGITFDNSIVNAVGQTFINQFRVSIDNGLMAGLDSGINNLGPLTQSSEFSTHCGAQTTYTHGNSNDYSLWRGINCNVGASFSGTASDAAIATTIPEPSTVVLFSLGLAGVFLSRRETGETGDRPRFI